MTTTKEAIVTANLFHCKILTPDRAFFDDDVEAISIMTDHGSVGILHDTLPFVSATVDGVVRIQQGKKWMEAFLGDGFLEVAKNSVTVMASTAEWPYEIDENRVVEEIDEMEERLKKEQSIQEYKRAKAQLARQFARLKIKKDLD